MGVPHPVPDQQILFKKSLMVIKHPYGSPEVPYTSESQNPLLKIFQFYKICVGKHGGFLQNFQHFPT